MRLSGCVMGKRTGVGDGSSEGVVDSFEKEEWETEEDEEDSDDFAPAAATAAAAAVGVDDEEDDDADVVAPVVRGGC